ncbi:MAG: ATP-binding cassette domain-containing protein [Sedimentisphaerales bacterium]|nr:ATP-binding cassette domain-containing protein [Sedimentisphaerales bacterium]
MTSAIEIKDYSYAYADGTAALKDISLIIEHGQKVVLIGPNGAGKSTLLLAMAGFVKGTGKIFVDGIEVNKKNNKKIRGLIGCCVENPEDQLFMPTIYEDVAFGPLNLRLEKDEVKARTRQALETVGLWSLADKPPHHLSAGQKRAAAIATILSMKPGIITLDEPTSSLDPTCRNKILRIIRELPQTIIVATCDMNFAAEFAEHAVLIDNGQKTAEGEPQKIMAEEQLMTSHGLEVPWKYRKSI